MNALIFHFLKEISGFFFRVIFSKFLKQVFLWFYGCQILMFLVEKLPYFSIGLQHVAKCEGWLNVLLSYPVYSQIWLNLLLKDCHISCVRKSKENTLITTWKKSARKKYMWTFNYANCRIYTAQTIVAFSDFLGVKFCLKQNERKKRILDHQYPHLF